MPDVRALFLDALDRAISLVARPEVATRWDEPSALQEFTVRGLAGHAIGRTTAAVLEYLDAAEPPDESVIDAAKYYAAVMTPDIHDAGNTGVRERGEQFAAGGRDGLLDQAKGTLATLRERLAREPVSRRVQVYAGLVMTLDDYLVTRLVELVVHTDDLAVSVGVDPPVPDREAGGLVIDAVVGMARIQHGDLVMLRALTRAERVEINPFPVF